MYKMIFEFALYLLAVYGMINLIAGIAGLPGRRSGNGRRKVQMILMVKDAEEVIEGSVKSIFAGNILKKLMANDKLIILDMGSTDKTRDILAKLQDQNDGMLVLKQEEKEKVFSDFS